MTSSPPDSSRLKRDVADLLTCSINDIGGIYEQALDVFARYTAPGWTGTFRAADVNGTFHYDELHQRAPRWAVRDLAAIESYARLDISNRIELASLVRCHREGRVPQ